MEYVGPKKSRRAILRSLEFIPHNTEAAANVLPQVMEVCASHRGSADFHHLASAFGEVVVTRDVTPVEEIRRLRAKGLSLAEIARQAGTTIPVVRRVVSKLVRTPRLRRQEEAARRIHALGVPWPDQVAAWHAETGQCGVTY